MRVLRFIVCVVAVVLLGPSLLYAQASIAGVVKDTSGAILPGVTVEAASDVLIEKVRTVVSDGSGLYRIIDLRPGVYTVTFTLTGFNTSRREGIELSGNVVANIDAEMRVGALEETITVTGAAPVVDVTSTRGQQVMNREMVRDLPTSRQYYAVAALIPGMVVSNQTQDVGGSSVPTQPDWVMHGSRIGDGRLSLDGITLGQRGSGGANRSMFQINVGAFQETTISTSGGLGEAETGGVAMNFVPREGGNTNRGSFYVGFANGAMQGNNFTDELRAKGLSTPNELDKVWEVSPAFGGPLKRDRLWYFAAARHNGTRNLVAGMYQNKNVNDPTKWTYEPDLTKRAIDDGTFYSASIRLTLQANQKNKFNIFWDEQDRKVSWITGGNATTSPDAANRAFGNPNRLYMVTWSSPVSNRLLVEGGWGGTSLQWSGKERPGYNRNMIRVVEQAGTIPGLTYRGMNWASNWLNPYQLRGSLSYVTGTHTSKIGYISTWNNFNDDTADPQSMAFRFNNGVPNQLTLNHFPRTFISEIDTHAIYAQDSWVIRRLTLQGGLRYDYLTSFFPEQQVGNNRFIPNGFKTPATDGVSIHNITPRMAGAFDLFGTGSTAVKFTLGKFMEAQETGVFGEGLNAARRMASTTTRSWNDANRNFVPDCDLLNPAAQSPATTGSIDTCGAYSNANFGKNIVDSTYDPEIISGWGIRPYNWEFSASVQREVISRVGVTVGYFRRWYGNFVATDNLALAPGDFNSFSVVVPADSRLPDGGGQTISGLYNVTPAKFGLNNNLVTSTSNYAKSTEHWNGFDINVNARGAGGLTLSGGISTGKKTEDSCEIRAKLPELTPLNPYCKTAEPFLTQFKMLGAYLVPRLDVLFSATFQSAPGPALAANFNVPNAQVLPSLGRPLSGGAANVTVNLIEPGKLYGDRTNQMDFRVAKVLRFGTTRTNIGVDLYNALNVNPITSYNQTFGTAWLRPQAIMPARFVKLSVQVDF
jgi:hypothetical protein